MHNNLPPGLFAFHPATTHCLSSTPFSGRQAALTFTLIWSGFNKRTNTTSLMNSKLENLA